MALCESDPLAATMASGYTAAGVALDVQTVNVDVPEPEMEFGLNVPVAPVGNPVTLRLTTPLNPFNAVTGTV